MSTEHSTTRHLTTSPLLHVPSPRIRKQTPQLIALAHHDTCCCDYLFLVSTAVLCSFLSCTFTRTETLALSLSDCRLQTSITLSSHCRRFYYFTPISSRLLSHHNCKMKSTALLFAATALLSLASADDKKKDAPITTDNPKRATYQAILQTDKPVQGSITGVSNENSTGVSPSSSSSPPTPTPPLTTS